MPLLAAMLYACGLALLKIRSSNLIALSFFRVFTPFVMRNSTVRLICLTCEFAIDKQQSECIVSHSASLYGSTDSKN